MRSLSMKYSDWEVVEMYCAWRNGATKQAIAQRYKTNEKYVSRMFTRLENAARGSRTGGGVRWRGRASTST